MAASFPQPRRSDGGLDDPAPLRLVTYPQFPNQNAPDVNASDKNGLQWLTTQILFHYQRCPRRAFLDHYGDRQLKVAPSDYLEKLKQDSADHRQQILADYYPLHRPRYLAQDWLAGSAATVALMAKGVNYISQGVLTAETAAHITLVSTPDLLIRVPGDSIWGDWQYVPADIKFGKKPKLDYQLVAAFHALVVRNVQGSWPETSWLILREGKSYAVDLQKQLPRLDDLLYACMEDLQNEAPPEVFIAHSRCDLCNWFSHCHSEARATQHLSLLPGVTLARYNHLRKLNLTTVAALAAANPAKLSTLPGFGESVAEKMVHQAQAVLGDRAIPRLTKQLPQRFPLSAEQLPSAPIELYFDSDAAP